MEKMMTLMEAWQGVPLKKTICAEDAFAHGFASGRQGMIPAKNAVVIDWSHEKLRNRSGIVILPVSQEHVSTAQDVWGADKLYKYIPRPKPVWVPKIGEAVFVRTLAEGKVKFGVVNKIDGIYFEVYFPDCYSGDHSIEYLKPGKIDHIGKPWDAIPGGVE